MSESGHRSAFLVGVEHKEHGLGPGWELHAVRNFVQECRSLMEKHKVRALGEEFCDDALPYTKGSFGGFSALGELCTESGGPYLGFDLTDEQCRARGIPDSQAAIELPANQAASLKTARQEGRENAWVERINEWGEERVLLVVGANHLESLGQKLEAAGWACEVLRTPIDWEPPSSS